MTLNADRVLVRLKLYFEYRKKFPLNISLYPVLIRDAIHQIKTSAVVLFAIDTMHKPLPFLISSRNTTLKYIYASLFCLVFTASFAQSSFLLGKWEFEKMSSHLGLDEVTMEVANHAFKDLSISFDSTHYAFSFADKQETGTWKHITDKRYLFTNVVDMENTVMIKKMSEYQIYVQMNKLAIHLKKSPDPVTIDKTLIPEELDVKLLVRESDLVGKWWSDGSIINATTPG